MRSKNATNAIRQELDGVFGETLYRQLVENASDGIAIIQDTRIRYANPTLSIMLGYSLEEVLGTSYTQYLTPESVENVASFYQGLDRLSVPEIYETTVRHKDGRTLPIEINTSVITLGGRPADFIIFRSLKERRTRRQIAERMQQSRKLESLGVLAGGISHDFNNLLQGILGNADLALMYETDLDLVRVCLKDIKHAANQASELALKMLAYSGKGSFDIQDIDINQLIMETADLLDMAIPKNCRLQLDLAPGIPPIHADQLQLSQVIINLLNNALEAVGDHTGTITISTQLRHCDADTLSETYLDESLPEGPYLRLSVSDSGCGIEEGVKDKIFDPFFSTKFTGRGLGLAAVLGIIRAHKGAVSVQSAFDAGTTFNVFLPIADHAPTSELTSTTALPPRELLANTILLVDDESTVRTTAARILERFGYSVIVAPSGHSALNIYSRVADKIDLVLLDMMMPQMDGKETFARLYAINNGIKVILMSGYHEAEVKGRFTTPSPKGFLQKPFTAKKLISQIRQILED